GQVEGMKLIDDLEPPVRTSHTNHLLFRLRISGQSPAVIGLRKLRTAIQTNHFCNPCAIKNTKIKNDARPERLLNICNLPHRIKRLSSRPDPFCGSVAINLLLIGKIKTSV